MRFVAVLNREGGSLRDTDIDRFTKRLGEILGAAGHEIEASIVDGEDIVDALRQTFERNDCDVVLVGGGDGTVSAAAAKAMNSDKILAILPAGTMNLFARGLGLPLDLEEAAQIFAKGHARKVDIATANGRPFVHQFSVGMHPRMVRLREGQEFESRLGKMRASIGAAIQTLFDPPRVKGTLIADGVSLEIDTPSLGISNNMFGEGHLPYAERPDRGVLGIYVARVRDRRGIFRFAADMLLGHWRDAPEIDLREARQATLKLAPGHRGWECSIDGELVELKPVTELEIHPGALAVLTPPPE